MARVHNRLAPSVKVLIMRGSELAVMGYLSPDLMVEFLCLVCWQGLVEEAAHLLSLVSISFIKATVSTVEHVIVVGVVVRVWMWRCDGVTCVLLLEVFLLAAVTNSVLLRLRSRPLEHLCKVQVLL